MRDRDTDATQRIKAAGVQVLELAAQAREQLRQLALKVHERFADRVGQDYLPRVYAEITRASR
jgi:TRAP-type C4-dicarboxylate transport system substrate-binding protein